MPPTSDTRPLLASVASAVLLAAVPVSAHDLWLIPPSPAEVGPLIVAVHSGSEFPKSEHAPKVETFALRSVVRPDGKVSEMEVAAPSGPSGRLRFRADGPGVYVVAVRTAPKILTLPADKFNAYLVSDGLPHVYRDRVKAGTLGQPGRERYSKSVKAVFRVGKGGSGDPCRVLGLPLEIVPLRDPLAVKPEETLKVRVLFQGKPLADANLGWCLPDDGEAPRGTVRTDRKGEALVPIGQTGPMTIRLTHMTRPDLADYEYESFWSTLTFRVGS